MESTHVTVSARVPWRLNASREVRALFPQKRAVMYLASTGVLSFKSLPGAPPKRPPSHKDALPCPFRDCHREEISSSLLTKVARRGLSPKWGKTPLLFSHPTYSWQKRVSAGCASGKCHNEARALYFAYMQRFAPSVLLLVAQQGHHRQIKAQFCLFRCQLNWGPEAQDNKKHGRKSRQHCP